MTWLRGCGAICVAVCGCLSRPIGPDDGNASGGSSGDGGVTTSTTTTTTGTTGATTSDDLPGTESATTTDSGCGSFIGCFDFGDGGDCDPFAQDCPAGEKCMPWANDGGNAWNANRCSPVADDPAQLDEPCLVEGSGVSGVDDCDFGLMCWDVDLETNIGTCIALCSGTVDDPMCPPGVECIVANEGVLPICVAVPCDPIAPQCEADESCLFVSGGFFCRSLVNEPPGNAMEGEPCESVTACAPGLTCVQAPLVPNCAGLGCCASYCDINNPSCTSPTTCIPALADPIPPEFAHIGVCVLPS